MHRLAPLVAFAVVATAGPALADMPNDPCQGASVGDTCMTLSGEDGTCQEVSGSNFLTCEEGTPSTSSGSTDDDGDGEDDDGGCSVGGDGGTFGWAALGLLLALRRRR